MFIIILSLHVEGWLTGRYHLPKSICPICLNGCAFSFSHITIMCQPFSHFIILLIFLGSPGSQAIHISVIHTECSGNKNRMVNLHICSTFLPGILNIHRSEEHTSELQSRGHLVCRHLLE